jgi:hypothetical protein
MCLFYVKEWDIFTFHEHIEVEGIKKGNNKFHLSVYGWEGMCLSVRIKKLNIF